MIDKIDGQILDLLKENARESFAEIGRTIGLSASSVRERMQRLTDQGVIKKFTIEIDQSCFGNDIEAFVFIKLFQGKLKPFITLVNKIEGVKKSYRIMGDQNVLMVVAIKDHRQFQHFLDKIRDFGDTTSYMMLSEITD